MNKNNFKKEKKKDFWVYLVLIMLLMVPVGIIYFHYVTIKASWELHQIEEKGVDLNASLDDIIHTDTNKGVETYTFYYSYNVDGKLYKKSKYVDASKHYIYRNSDSIPIKYLASNPSVSDLPGNYGNDDQWMQLIILDIVLFFVLIALIYHYLKGKKEQKKKFEVKANRDSG